MLIVNEPLEILELNPMNNDCISLVQKKRAKILDEWNTKIIILNRREALLVRKGISDIMFTPRQPYQAVGQG